MNHLRKTMIALALTLPAAAALAGQPAESAQPASPPGQQAVPASAHLGVLVRNVPPALAAQLPAEVPRGQGVMVVQVQPDSPAARAGLQNFDVLLSYDDQKLFSADQLSALVAGDQPGRKVKLRVARAGKVNTVEVELGQQPARHSMPAPWQAAPYRMPPMQMPLPPRPMMPAPMPKQEQLPEITTESFEALSVEKLPNGKYRASIEFLGADGDKHSFKYEGSRKEIREQIQKTKGLPAPARHQLLNALGMSDSPWRGLDRHLPDLEKLFRRWERQEW